MKDEFNQPKEGNEIREFSLEGNLKEYNDGTEFFQGAAEKTDKSPKESSYKKIKKMGFLMAATLSVAVITNSIYPEFSILPEKTVNAQTGEPDVPALTGDTADEAFPVLGNIEPYEEPLASGFIENYVLVIDDVENRGYPIYQGNPESSSFTLDGISYNRQTNVLTLTDCEIPVLEVNLMGNGFTINLEGENNIGTIRVWGYGYGGSVTFTGDGSLTINKDSRYEVGLELQCENSRSCIMIDKDAKLNIYGSKAAVAVYSSTCEKGIYYLAPVKMSGGVRAVTDVCPTQNYSDGLGTNYTIVDENGDFATYVKFSQ